VIIISLNQKTSVNVNKTWLEAEKFCHLTKFALTMWLSATNVLAGIREQENRGTEPTKNRPGEMLPGQNSVEKAVV
jgi:hypothetical protein